MTKRETRATFSLGALLLGLSACGGGAAHIRQSDTAVTDSATIDGPRAWQMLSRSLPGTWTREGTEGRAPFIVSYRLISNGSALVEVWGVGGARETETVFHPDHADVLMTHYCAQGNQPRLRAVRATTDTVELRLRDVTNRAPDQNMLVQRTLHIGQGTLEITETYRRPDGTDETSVYKFTRREPTIS